MRGIFASIARLFERNPQFSGPLAELSQDPVALAELLGQDTDAMASALQMLSFEGLVRIERVPGEHAGAARVRLLGVYYSGLSRGPAQMSLLTGEEEKKEERLSRSLDAIRDKFGKEALVAGKAMRYLEEK